MALEGIFRKVLLITPLYDIKIVAGDIFLLKV